MAGMLFDNEDATYNSYHGYAKRIGFSERKHNFYRYKGET